MRRIIARIDALPPLQRQLARFLATGGLNTVFAYAAYAFFAGLLDMGYAAALVLSWCAGVMFSFATFRAFVFTNGNRSLKAFARFLPVYVALLLVNLGALHALAGLLGWNKLLAQAVIIPFCAVLSFIFNRVFVFREKKA